MYSGYNTSQKVITDILFYYRLDLYQNENLKKGKKKIKYKKGKYLLANCYHNL